MTPGGPDPAASQEYVFTEQGCTLLLLQTHRYLERLAAVVDQVAARATP